MIDEHPLFGLIDGLHTRIHRVVVAVSREQDPESLASVDREAHDDTIYAIDAISETELLEYFRDSVSAADPVIVIAEGFPDDGIVFPEGTSRDNAKWRVIVDPIDGTRGLMYQKRSAWILTGVARNVGESTSLGDIEFAMQTELPIVKQNLYDRFWASAGKGVHGVRRNLDTITSTPLRIRPSTAKSIAHGFATISRFFPGGRDVIAAIDDELVSRILGPVEKGRASCFEDQYISSGGQLYSLMTGKDRFIADIRPIVYRALERGGKSPGITSHPYDVCTELIAREAGVVITNGSGDQLDYRLDTTSQVEWFGYANTDLHALIWPVLKDILAERSLLE